MDVSLIHDIFYAMKIVSCNITVKIEGDAGAPYQLMQTSVWSGSAAQVME